MTKKFVLGKLSLKQSELVLEHLTLVTLTFLCYPGWMCGASGTREVGQGILELLIGNEKVTDGRTYRQTNRLTCAKQYALSSLKGGRRECYNSTTWFCTLITATVSLEALNFTQSSTQTKFSPFSCKIEGTLHFQHWSHFSEHCISNIGHTFRNTAFPTLVTLFGTLHFQHWSHFSESLYEQRVECPLQV